MNPWKLVDAAFSRLWLLVIPIVLVPTVVILLSASEPEYRSRATIWVTRPENVDPGVLFSTAPWYESPAATQANVMSDLLSTESFRASVAETAGLDVSDPVEYVEDVASIRDSGNNIIQVAAETAEPEQAQAIVSAIIDEYQARATTVARETAELQVEYFTTQLTPAAEELEARRAELEAYDAANPQAEASATTVDVERQQLVAAFESQQMVVDGILQSLQEAQRSAAGAPQALAATFTIQDPASEPELIEVPVTRRFGYPIAGLVFGIAISASYLYVVYRTDHSIRTSQDLAELPVPLLGFVPQIRRHGGPGFLDRPPMCWLAFKRNRDYARNVAASMSTSSTSTPSEVSP